MLSAGRTERYSTFEFVRFGAQNTATGRTQGEIVNAASVCILARLHEALLRSQATERMFRFLVQQRSVL
jgi:hypothetical protein